MTWKVTGNKELLIKILGYMTKIPTQNDLKKIYWPGSRDGQAELDPGLGDSGFHITTHLFKILSFFSLLQAV